MIPEHFPEVPSTKGLRLLWGRRNESGSQEDSQIIAQMKERNPKEQEEEWKQIVALEKQNGRVLGMTPGSRGFHRTQRLLCHSQTVNRLI